MTLYHFLIKITVKKMMIFFFIENRKIKHSRSYGFFYVEIESKKGYFVTVILNKMWYYIEGFYHFI
jgi:hypothetical protein